MTLIQQAQLICECTQELHELALSNSQLSDEGVGTGSAPTTKG